MKKTKAIEFHSSAKYFESSKMNYINKDISMGGVEGVDEYKNVAVDVNKVKMMAELIKQ